MKQLLILISILFFFSCDVTEPENVDEEPPTVVIQSPLSNAQLSDIVLISVLSQDNEGVNKVKFYINSTLYFTDTESPYEYNWDTNEESNGEFEIKVISYDNSDNQSEPVIINVSVLNTINSSEICNNQYSNIDGSLISCDEDCFNSSDQCYHLNDLSGLEALQQAFEPLNGLNLLEIGSQQWEDGRLISLNLSNSSLSGQLPSEIANLTALESLYLNDNLISGIPESICSLELNNFTLYDNQLCNGNNYPECVIDDVNCYGCIDDTACNYDEFATENQGCDFAEQYYDCDGVCLIDIDECGICGGTGTMGINCITDIDGNEYQAVQIGEQLWMSENLKATHYNNGEAIQYVQSESSEPNVWDNLSTGALKTGMYPQMMNIRP